MHQNEMTTNNDSGSILRRILYRLSPAIRAQVNRLDSIKIKSDITIQDYTDMSKDIQREVDENHFPKILKYKKINKS